MAIMSEEAIRDREEARLGGSADGTSTRRMSSRRLHASIKHNNQNLQSFKQGHGNSSKKLRAAKKQQQQQRLDSPKESGGSPADSDEQHGMVLPFDPLSLTFRDLHYYVDMPKVRSCRQMVPCCCEVQPYMTGAR